MITYQEGRELLDKTSKIPYPPIPQLYQNIRYANMIYDDYAGQLGELSAITQYIYEHILYKEKGDTSKLLLDIAIEEMRHLDILGTIIQRLGGKPEYIDSNKNLWSAKNVKYETKNFEEMVKYNIFSEEEAIQGYRKLIRYTNNMGLRRIFERIILDEKTHKEIFSRMI